MNVEATQSLHGALNGGGQVRVSDGFVPSGFEAIFLAHYGRVVSILMRLVGGRALAEELANEVFWKLSRQPEAAPLWANVGGWLYRAATHAGIDALRAAGRRRHYESAAIEVSERQRTTGGGPLDTMLQTEKARRVRNVLSAMKPGQAQLLLMRSSGSSYQEMAEALGVASSGVGTLLHRAETEFRRRYSRVTGEKGTA